MKASRAPASTEVELAQKDISKDIHFLGDLLGEVIVELSGSEVFQKEEDIRSLAKAARVGDETARAKLQRIVSALSLHEAEEIALAFTTYFELINIAEENFRIKVLNDRRKNFLKESFVEALQILKDRFSSSDLRSIVESLGIQLVFTAHPTEVKRRTILSKLHRIADLFDDPHVEVYSDSFREKCRREIASLWLTSRSRRVKPQVIDEVSTGLWYFQKTLFDVVPLIEERFNQALTRVLPHYRIDRPWIKFGSWIGGDRDGHPEVSPDVTDEALKRLSAAAVERVRGLISDLAEQLSFSEDRDHVSREILDQLERWKSDSRLKDYIARSSHEPYRCFLHCLGVLVEDITERELIEHILMLERNLKKARASKIFERALDSLHTQVKTFGLHTAQLDFRQESSVHEEGLAEVFQTLGISKDYSAQDEKGKLAVLNEALRFKFNGELKEKFQLGEKFLKIFEPLLVARKHDPASLGVYIISMTEAASDVLEVLVMMEWAKVQLPIVPLFETLKDLRDASAILDDLFSQEKYKAYLEAQENKQTVMLGYSDSNKDAGFASSNFQIFRAQRQIDELCQKRSVGLCFFHGRGGSISRGGGPAAQAILSQPAGMRDGQIRITEQGEILSSRYHRREIAARVIEQIAFGSLLAIGQERSQEQNDFSAFVEAMDKVSVSSNEKYRSLVKENPSLIEFWNTVTPIEFIKQLNIGSRPASRKKTEKVEDLRAIPWVFSWLQTRFVLPGWYGLGSGMQALGDIDLLQKMYKDWPFFQTLLDNAHLTLGKTDLPIAKLYCELYAPESERQKIIDDIESELQLTEEWLLKATGQSELLGHQQILKQSIELRNPYVDPLNFIQVEMMRRYRESKSETERAKILNVIQLTISGISSGLRNSG